MPTLATQIESLLLYTNKPMKAKDLLKATGAEVQAFSEAIASLESKYNNEQSGIRLLIHNDAYQLTTSPENAQLIEQVFAAEMSGELTKPALETLTIIAYRGPISKPELELIRGVNCSLILRNLMMRGLVVEEQGKEDFLPVYSASGEFLQYLGFSSVKELPQFEELSSHQLLEELLKQRTQNQAS